MSGENQALQMWLNLAPTPPPLKEGFEYHVFLSYSSKDRKWVIQLYDILKHQGFKVFMDQFELQPKDKLGKEIRRKLSLSQFACICWSENFSESEWCMREMENIETLSERGKLHYGVLELDNHPIPTANINLQEKLRLDFSKAEDGPFGSILIKLLYAVAGKKLDESVVFAAINYDEAFAEMANSIDAAALGGDVDRLMKLGQSEELPMISISILGCEVAQALINMDKGELALEILTNLQKRFPSALRPKQLAGLANKNMGRLKEANFILGKLYAADHRDGETLGIYASCWMAQYVESGNVLFLRKSRDLYSEAFSYAPDNEYVGINAAAKSLMLDTPEDKALAYQLAHEVHKLLDEAEIQGDMWKLATLAEAYLILGNFREAGKWYDYAVVSKPYDVGSHQAMLKQIKVLIPLLEEMNENNKEALLSVFAHLEPKT